MDHPLAMDAEAMRRAGYATVDALVARLADPEADPVLRRGGAADMRTRLGGPPPEQPGDYGAVLARVLADVLPYAARTDHPGYLAFVPSFTTWPAALAELTAAAANPYCGAWMESAGAAQVELEVIDWFRGWIGLPDSTGRRARERRLRRQHDGAAGGPRGGRRAVPRLRGVRVGPGALVPGPDRAGHGTAPASGPGAADRRPLAAAPGDGGGGRPG